MPSMYEWDTIEGVLSKRDAIARHVAHHLRGSAHILNYQYQYIRARLEILPPVLNDKDFHWLWKSTPEYKEEVAAKRKAKRNKKEQTHA